MNYTEKHHLPQWEESDRILRTDFNSAMASIENGINTTASGLESKIAAAQAAAETKPYKVGSYVGNCKDKSVYLGFRPSFLIISGMTSDWPINYRCLVTGGSGVSDLVEFTSSGFRVVGYNEAISSKDPYLTADGETYGYIAFK